MWGSILGWPVVLYTVREGTVAVLPKLLVREARRTLG